MVAEHLAAWLSDPLQWLADLRPLAKCGSSFLPKEAALQPVVTSIHMVTESYPQIMCRRKNYERTRIFASDVLPVIQDCSKILSRGGLGERDVAGMKSNKRTHTAHKTQCTRAPRTQREFDRYLEAATRT